MKVGDLIRHKDYAGSLGIIVKTYGTPTGGRIHPPTIQIEWAVPPSDDFVDTIGSVWLEIV